MVTYVCDASAILRFLDGEAGADDVSELLMSAMRGMGTLLISAAHYGEIVGVLLKRYGEQKAARVLADQEALPIKVVDITGSRAAAAARLCLATGLPYLDAFALELAASGNHQLITADYDFKAAEAHASIRFLGPKRL